ncbi:hypothetical protein DRN86_02120 [Candidatus Geothermarchaeota archaeon]|nr:MAG: hypothetical protein DRN86_02120 [Candidatus Geothermarchaeota archaeon]
MSNVISKLKALFTFIFTVEEKLRQLENDIYWIKNRLDVLDSRIDRIFEILVEISRNCKNNKK